MLKTPLISVVIGTRPEVIKLAPVIKEFKKSSDVKIRIILTGQHKEMVSQSMSLFSLESDINLDLMKSKQSLKYITCNSIEGLSEDFESYKPELVIVQGDTTTAFAASLAAFYKKIPVAHVEAGLRTNNISDPFPEEINRRLISQIATLHFAPTEIAKSNLINSSVNGKIFMTGNTVIDALHMILERSKPFTLELDEFQSVEKLILTTVHRRENLGENLLSIIDAIKKTISKFSNVGFLIPMHPNPLVRENFLKHLRQYKRVFLIEPLDYEKLVSALKYCFFVLTDSGGLQEEAPSLGKPVLVLRKTTERIESIESGTAKLIGTNSLIIQKEISKLLLDKDLYRKMSDAVNPYGDGQARKRICNECKNFLRNNV